MTGKSSIRYRCLSNLTFLESPIKFISCKDEKKGNKQNESVIAYSLYEHSFPIKLPCSSCLPYRNEIGFQDVICLKTESFVLCF